MLTAFRNFGDTIIVKIFLGVLALSFVLWGIGDYLVGGRNASAVSVNGEDISVQEMYRAYQNVLNRASQQMGQPIDAQTSLQFGLPKAVATQLIHQRLLLQAASEMELTASPENVRILIRTNPEFQNADGKFDVETYKRNLGILGMTTEGFEKQLADDIQRSNIEQLFKPAFEDKQTLKRLNELENTQLTVAVLDVFEKHAPQVKQPTAEDLEAFFAQHQENYAIEQKRSFSVITLDMETLKPQIQVTDEELQTYYDENKADYKLPEKREISQIVVTDKETASDVLTLLEAKQDFATLAKTYSTDSFTKDKGGKLGLRSEEDLFPAIATTAFKLEQGAYSKAIETPLGVHIIQVSAIQPATQQTFTQVEKQVREAVTLTKLEDKFFTAQENVEDLLAAGTSASEMKQAVPFIELATYKDISASNSDIDEMTINTAFETPQGVGSDAIEHSDTKLAYVLVEGIEPRRIPELTEVRKNVLKNYISWKKLDALQVSAANMIQAMQNGSSLQAAARKAGIKALPKTYNNVARTQGLEILEPEVKSELFNLKTGQPLPRAIPTADGKGFSLVHVMERKAVPMKADEFKTIVNQAMANELSQIFTTALTRNAKIVQNPQAMNTAFDGVWPPVQN